MGITAADGGTGLYVGGLSTGNEAHPEVLLDGDLTEELEVLNVEPIAIKTIYK